MAKRGLPEHPKIQRLAKALGLRSCAFAVGVVECLWHFAYRYATDGDLSAYRSDEIASGLHYSEDDPEALVEALVQSGFLERVRGGRGGRRLIIHDWADHADDAIHIKLAREVRLFADGTVPKMTRIAKEEREELQKRFENVQKRFTEAPKTVTQRSRNGSQPEPKSERTENAQEARGVRTAFASLRSALHCSAPHPRAHEALGKEEISTSSSEEESRTGHDPSIEDDSPVGEMIAKVVKAKSLNGRPPDPSDGLPARGQRKRPPKAIRDVLAQRSTARSAALTAEIEAGNRDQAALERVGLDAERVWDSANPEGLVAIREYYGQDWPRGAVVR